MKKIVLAVIAGVSCFALLEVACRVVHGVKEARLPPQRHTENTVSLYRPHPYLGYVLNPEHREHTPQGFRGPGHIVYEANSNVLTIVCVGGSSTYGTRTAQDETYPHQLQEILKSKLSQEVRVINAGVAGYSTANLIPLLSLRVVDLKPNVVIFYVGFNDVWPRVFYTGYRSDYAHAQRSWRAEPRPAWRRSVLLSWVVDRTRGAAWEDPHIHDVVWHRQGGNPKKNWAASSAAAFRRNLLTLIAVAKVHGVRPVFVAQASDFHTYPVEPNDLWQRAADEYGDIVKEVSIVAGVGVVDIRGPMSNKSEYFADAIHMSKAGNRERALIIADYLLDEVLIEK